MKLTAKLLNVIPGTYKDESGKVTDTTRIQLLHSVKDFGELVYQIINLRTGLKTAEIVKNKDANGNITVEVNPYTLKDSKEIFYTFAG